MEISETEIGILSGYAASEMVGGLILGQAARRTQDPEMRYNLMLQCAEETKHGALWAEVIHDLGGYPLPAHDPEKKHYFSRAGNIENEVELLAFIHCFEQLVLWHLSMHAARPNCHPKVHSAIQSILADEAGHLSWTEQKLESYKHTQSASEVEALISKYIDLTIEVYEDEIARMEISGNSELQQFASLLRKNWPKAKHDIYAR